MQCPEPNETQLSSVVKEPAPADLLRSIPGMAVTMSQQHQELAELMKALQGILKVLPGSRVRPSC